MKNVLKNIIAFCFVCVLFGFVLACSNNVSLNASQTTPIGSAKLSMDYYESSDISRFEITVTASDMDSITESFSMSEEIDVVIYNIPAGTDRLFNVFAYDSSDLLIFEGSAVIDVEVAETALINITLVETNPSPDTLGDAQNNGFSILSVPTGFWGLNGYHTASGLVEVKNNFGISVFQVASSGPNYNTNTLFPLVKNAGLTITLRTTANYSALADGSGNFDLSLWEASFAAWTDPTVVTNVTAFIDDGTFVGHMIADDIFNYSYEYGGTNPTVYELEAMACMSKAYYPDLMTFVRASSIDVLAVAPAGFEFDCLDALVNQYQNNFGDVETYAQETYDAAEELGVDIINGLNICDGGDGSSGQAGWRAGRYTMSADEITEYGSAMLNTSAFADPTDPDGPELLMFLMWEYDGNEQLSDGSYGDDYFNQTDLMNALYGLSVL